MRTNNVNQNFTKELVNVVLEEMQLSKNEMCEVKESLLVGFFCYLTTERADCLEDRKAICVNFKSVFMLLDSIEKA